MTTHLGDLFAAESINASELYVAATSSAHKISKTTIEVTEELLNPHEALRTALVRLERANMAREANFSWSSITACNRRVAQCLTGGFPALGGGSLLSKTIDLAFRAYADADPGDRLAPLRSYFDSVLTTLDEVFRFQVFCRDARGNTRRWVTMSSMLTDFLRTNNAIEVSWFSNPPGNALSRDVRRGMLAASVLNYEEMVLTRRKDVMGGMYSQSSTVRPLRVCEGE